MSKNYKNNSKWVVHGTDFEADFFTQGFVSEHTILAAVTVGCPSNGSSASSTSGLLAPAAQTSAGRAACSCLSWPAVMPRRPHRPLLLPSLPQGIPLLTHTPCYSAATAASHRSEPVNPRTPLRVGIHCRVFPGSASSPS